MDQATWNRAMRKQISRRRLLSLVSAAGTAAVLAACSDKFPATSGSKDPEEESSVDISVEPTSGERPAGWTDATHSKDAAPNYEVVFPADELRTMRIRVAPDQWELMLANMVELFGQRGTGEGLDGNNGPFGPRDNGGQVPGAGNQPPRPGNGGGFPGGGGGFPGGGGGGFGPSENPMWAPATIEHDGNVWTNVGLRFKGNSSLRGSWNEGTDRMPFKLDFDEFEDQHPEIENQRFYGFKQLSLMNNYGDESHMREILASETLAAAGLAAARTAPYEVLLDHGEGETSLGLYTVVEVIDDTVVQRCFDDDSGNIYEAEGNAASFAEGSDSQIETSFEVESGDSPDWSDIKALYSSLHSETRTTDAEAWKSQLEEIFDVPTFLNWLGVAAVIGHWDTYGQMTHNYYLYSDPASGQLTWISWDHNFVLGSGGGPGGGPGAGFGGRAAGGPGGGTSFDKTTVGDNWPLISYLIAQPEYAGLYEESLRATSAGAFQVAELHARCDSLAALLRPVAGRAAGFDAAVESLKATIESQAAALSDYLEA